jgi:hypothetical protein
MNAFTERIQYSKFQIACQLKICSSRAKYIEEPALSLLLSVFLGTIASKKLFLAQDFRGL